jgi:transcriptional regulator GlxA family with amidase domain
VRAALADIELLVGESTLCAGSLARRRGVSRRRLDALFMEHLGSTVAAQILERRLAQCAANLCDWRKRHRSVASIAIDAGFKTGAHFSRRFKHRFGSTAREWRLRHLPTGSR